MKKLKLFIAAAALMVGVGAQAQKDVTSTYITNATLSSLDGWTNVNFNTPVSGNGTIKIGDNNQTSYNTVGYATECYEGWSSVEKSEFSLTQKITLPAGEYTLVNYSFFREGQNYNTDAATSRAYLKAGNNQVLVKTLGSITASGYANSQAEGAVCFDSKMYRNTLDFTIDADNTEIEIGVSGTFNTEITKSWMILGKFELIKTDEAATMDSPFDVTGYITNPGFEYRDMTGWTLSESGAIGTQINNQSFKTGLHYAEKWQPATDGALTARSMSQTLSNLPEGYYKLTANLGGDGTYVDLNGKTASWTADGDYTIGYVLGANENLTITAGKTAEGTANWIHFDNFKLQFCGDVAAALTTLCGQVSNYDGKIPTAAYTALQTNVAAQNQTYNDVDDLLAAIDAVQALYDAADLLIDPYTEAKALITEATTLQAVDNDNSEANSTFADAISTANTDVEAATTAADINSATSTLKAAMKTYVFAANPVGDGAQFDCTFLMTNPDLSGFTAWTKVDNVDGWYTDQNISGQNAQVMKNDGVACSKGNAFFEYWSETAAANGEFALYNKVNLPDGTFTINCFALATANGVAGATNSAIYFYANDTQGSLVSADVLTEQTISFVNSTPQDVKIGLKTLTGNEFRWMGIGYVELYKVPAQTYTVDEDAAWDNTQSGAGAVTLKRTIKAGINTLVLPFSMTQAEVEDKFGADSKVYAISSYDATAENITFTTKDGISANEPCLLKATEDGNSYELENRTIVAGEPVKNATNVTMTGSYAASITVPTDSYIISGDKIYVVDSEVTMKNTRAYITTTTSDGARVLKMSFDGETTTGIVTLENGQLNIEEGTVYDLSGRKVNTLSKGIYVVNGKKVIK